MDTSSTSLFLGAISFEERCTVAAKSYLDGGGCPASMQLARLADDSLQLEESIAGFSDLGTSPAEKLDRFSSRSLWTWVWNSIQNVQGEVIIDATCLPRELLGMVLFALSVRRKNLKRVRILYVSAPSNAGGYATQNKELPKDDRWLSKGVAVIRSILGYPGDFASEKRRHVVAFAGHEIDRLREIIVYLEPDRLSLSGEREGTSTVHGAKEFSDNVVKSLRQEIAQPECHPVDFSAKSIEDTYKKIEEMQIDSTSENVTLVAMNTKLSFIGANLYALHDRRIRMVYAVPEEYNPLYCVGKGELSEFDITELVLSSQTTPAR